MRATRAEPAPARAGPIRGPSADRPDLPPVVATAGRDLGSRSRQLVGLQRLAGNASVTRALQRTVVQRDQDHEKALAAIQGQAMYALLPSVAALPPPVRADERAAQFVGGPRLILAIRAVQNKGNWAAFASANATELVALPLDQIDDLMRYVGAPATVRTFDRTKFDNRFDALVDPSTGTITLIMRIKVEMVEGQTYSGDPVGTKDWEKNNIPAFKQFGPKMKSVIESAWSGTGSVKPVTKGLAVPAFATKVSVQLVDSGEHISFKVYGATANVRSNVNQRMEPGANARSGALQVGDNDLKPTSLEHPDHSKVSSQQVTSAHEFGHAMGLQHVRCAGDGVCYGVNQAEYGSIMGGGMGLDPVAIGSGKGAHVHDNLVPFEKIGEVWGKEVFPGSLAAKLSVWGPA